ncbi:hypothetical protein SETIT_3G388800v2 [Setaria italica]|uniref:F-box domain-containing protein n=1 Tax=Setaria italica TaxID=4555 RepID=A0A368QND9_SETIT|nr:hypothetical protein SETIT_3G388800v2 [Setaria italica]
MAASAARRIAAAPAAAHPPFPDELLEEIFLRLNDAADLTRASAACASFRRVVSARAFLRRFRSLHAPSVLGFFDVHGFHTVAPPHRYAPAARALARHADLAFSFLPEPRRWGFLDARDGLILHSRRITGTNGFAELVVSDPLYRRYVLVPPIPEDLAASVSQRYWSRLTSFLAPPRCEDVDGDDIEDMRSPLFSVISTTIESENKVVAFVFCSGNGKWQGTRYTSSCSLPSPHRLFSCDYQRSYAHGCFHWIVDSGYSYSLVLDTREVKFTTIDLPLPSKNRSRRRAVVEAGEGMLGLLTFDDTTIRLSRRTWRNNGVGEEEWQPYKTAPFPRSSNGKTYEWFSAGAADEVYLLMIGRESRGLFTHGSRCNFHYHTLDLKTLLLERLDVSDRIVVLSTQLYARSPPLLTSPEPLD